MTDTRRDGAAYRQMRKAAGRILEQSHRKADEKSLPSTWRAWVDRRHMYRFSVGHSFYLPSLDSHFKLIAAIDGPGEQVAVMAYATAQPSTMAPVMAPYMYEDNGDPFDPLT